ncbi:MAG: PAS domain S-box protein [Desulfovibrionales bacterium]|nr:PAS domain S-box protein [Desulfovibrionales bacterium]
MKHSLAVKILAVIALVLIVCLGLHSWGTISFLQSHAHSKLSVEANRLSKTILLSTRYAMMVNARGDLHQIVQDIAEHPDITFVRIYDQQGVIRFSTFGHEVGKAVSKDAVASTLTLNPSTSTAPATTSAARSVATQKYKNERLTVFSPIVNDAGCSAASCHAHSLDSPVLGALEVSVQTKTAALGLAAIQYKILGLTGGIYVLAVTLLALLLRRYVTNPIQAIIASTDRIRSGMASRIGEITRRDELGQLASSVKNLEESITKKQHALDRKRQEYQELFEHVPCSITVQDRTMRIMKYNKEFADQFSPAPHAYCYEAYKGRTEKCPNCLVEKTFETGRSYCSEESRVNPDGSKTHLLLHVTPVFDEQGTVVAVMEMGIDISARKRVEEQLVSSEAKYHAIFNHIPNAVFVLDEEDFTIIDCNEIAERSYGYPVGALHETSFIALFPYEEHGRARSYLKAFSSLNRVRQRRKDRSIFYVDFRLSPAVYNEKNVLLVSATDVTDRLETEQKLIQAGKMATLGEMATGVAHELNQPLTVIKAASNFIARKVNNAQAFDPEILRTMVDEIDSHVDRASQIIDHMRAFGRQSDHRLECVCVNTVIEQSVALVGSQLAVRGIAVETTLQTELPKILAVANRLEQVFINLLLNSRDAIEERCESESSAPRVITLCSYSTSRSVVAEVWDTGTGVASGLNDKIFEPFYTTKKVGKGTGLGLSISYGLIKDFGGTIKVRTLDSGGACFTITFPNSTASCDSNEERVECLRC